MERETTAQVTHVYVENRRREVPCKTRAEVHGERGTAPNVNLHIRLIQGDKEAHRQGPSTRSALPGSSRTVVEG